MAKLFSLIEFILYSALKISKFFIIEIYIHRNDKIKA